MMDESFITSDNTTEFQLKEFGPSEIKCIVGDKGFIGKGTFGAVLLGFHKKHRKVAVKCLQSHLVPDLKEYFMSREEKEVSVLHMINEHASHAVRFYGYAQWFDAIGLVMEYLPCGNLFQLLIRSKAELGALLRYRMCFEIAEGLYEIHNLPRLSETTRTKLVHGDVKAENILLTDRLHCKIGDFGSSKILMATGCTQFTLLEQNQENKEFTPIYVPPEFLINTAISITPSFDVYSYSVIIYLVLKRGLPFTKMTRSIYLDNVKKGVMPEPARDNILKDECKINKVSDLAVRILETVFLRCQAINPANRPPMREVMEELKAHSLLTVHKKRIYDQVVQARTNARVYDPRQEDHKCQTLDKFVPPLFRSRAERKLCRDTDAAAQPTKLSRSSMARTETDSDTLQSTLQPGQAQASYGRQTWLDDSNFTDESQSTVLTPTAPTMTSTIEFESSMKPYEVQRNRQMERAQTSTDWLSSGGVYNFANEPQPVAVERFRKVRPNIQREQVQTSYDSYFDDDTITTEAQPTVVTCQPNAQTGRSLVGGHIEEARPGNVLASSDSSMDNWKSHSHATNVRGGFSVNAPPQTHARLQVPSDTNYDVNAAERARQGVQTRPTQNLFPNLPIQNPYSSQFHKDVGLIQHADHGQGDGYLTRHQENLAPTQTHQRYQHNERQPLLRDDLEKASTGSLCGEMWRRCCSSLCCC